MRKSTYWVVFFTLLTSLIGCFCILKTSTLVLKTGVKLAALNDNIQFYNEAPQKTDEWTADIEKVYAEREALYKSENTFVRLYSNSHIVFKLVIMLIALAITLLVPVWYFQTVLKTIRYIQRRRKRQKAY